MFANYIKAKSGILHENVVLGINKSNSRGTVYTPEKMSKYMVYLLVRDYMHQHDNLTTLQDNILKTVYLQHTIESSQTDHLNYNEIRAILDVLKPLRIMDLACGTGLLLLAYLELHIQLMLSLSMTKKELSEHLIFLIENQLYAYDINAEAISHFKETLQVLMACVGASCELDGEHIQNANSLLTEVRVKVDLIIGNPPYIGEKGNLDVFEVIKSSTFGKKYYEGKMDYFYFFIYKAHQHLKPDGSLCYLTSNYFFTADGAVKLRRFIRNDFNISQMLDFNGEKIFKNKNLHACIYTLSLKPQAEIAFLDADLNLKKKINSDDVYLSSETFHFISDAVATQILLKISERFKMYLGDHYEIKQGIVSGADRFKGFPVFVYKETELDGLPKCLSNYVKPFYKNSSIKHFEHEPETPFYVLYIDKNFKQVEAISTLLESYRSKLETRREVLNGVRQWYELTWPRDASIFAKPKIVVPQRAKSNYFAYSEGPFHASADVYYILEKTVEHTGELTENQSLKGLTAFLNSYIVLLYLYYRGKRKGEALELYATPLKLVPYDPSLLQTLSKLYEMKLPVIEKIEAVNNILYETLDLSEEECEWLNNFGRKFL